MSASVRSTGGWSRTSSRRWLSTGAAGPCRTTRCSAGVTGSGQRTPSIAISPFSIRKTALSPCSRINRSIRPRLALGEAIAHLDEVVGRFLTHLSGLSARCGGHHLAVRRAVDKAVFEMRVEIAEAAPKLADHYRKAEDGEPEDDT